MIRTIKFKRSIYRGETINGKAEGKGTMKYNNGDTFTGMFKNNRKDYGTYKWASGRTYEGRFVKN